MVPVDTSIQSWTFGGFTFCAAAPVVMLMHPIASKLATDLDGNSFMELSLKPGVQARASINAGFPLVT
jgi:hypothetical protein